MIHIPNLTLERLLDHVSELGIRRAIGRRSIEPRAYAADAAGNVTTLGFPMPADDEGRHALAALLQSEMCKRGAIMSVLAIEAIARVGNEEIEALVLEGQQLQPVSRTEARLLRIERVGRSLKIRALHPTSMANACHTLASGPAQARA